MPQFLYERIVRGSTVTEPQGVPDPQFALPSTINWMRALAIIVESEGITFGSAREFYGQMGRVNLSQAQQNTIMEQLFFALHQLSALDAFTQVPKKADIARMAIIAWYYGLYNAASAMVAAKDGSHQDDHGRTANSWDSQFSARGLAMKPFHLRVSTLVKREADEQIRVLKNGNAFLVRDRPTTITEAYGASCSYFSGSVNWLRWKNEEEVKNSREFRDLNVSDFRTNAAKSLRDARLERRAMSFIHQAMRYRGKANYREALFLGYGLSTETLLEGYVEDTKSVLAGFISMAGAFVSKSIGTELWNEFYSDVKSYKAFTLCPSSVWSSV